MSGWAKWSPPPSTEAWHTLARLYMLPKEFLDNASKFGDRTLSIWKGSSYWTFATYNANNEENSVNTNLYDNIAYGD